MDIDSRMFNEPLICFVNTKKKVDLFALTGQEEWDRVGKGGQKAAAQPSMFSGHSFNSIEFN